MIYESYLKLVLWLVVILTEEESVNTFLSYHSACLGAYSWHTTCWLPLWLCFSTRVKKLRETLVAVQQLDKNMSSLRSWLAHIETELSRPIVYNTCDDQEIQRKLNQQQASGTTNKQANLFKMFKFCLRFGKLWLKCHNILYNTHYEKYANSDVQTQTCTHVRCVSTSL